MKTISMTLKSTGQNSRLFLCHIIAIIILPVSQSVYSQETRLNLSKYRHVIADTTTSVQFKITDSNNQERSLNTTLSDFTYSTNIRSAVVQNGTATKSVESVGQVAVGSGRRPIKGIALPELHIGVAGVAGSPVIFQILIDTLQPLIFDNTDKRYKGSFNIVLLEDSETLLSSKQLQDPVPVEISTGTRARVEPATVKISHTNLPSTSITITDDSMDDPVPLLIKTNFKLTGYRTYLKKESILQIETQSRSLQGLGIQTIPVHISLQGYPGNDSVNVTVNANKGSVEPMQIKIAKGTTGTVKYTSEGTGTATLNAIAQGFRGDQRDFQFEFPWLFIAFTLLGSLIGGLVKYVTNNSKKNAFSEIGIGVLTGFVFAVLFYVLSIEVFAIKLPRAFNEFAVFGISFLGVLFWNKIYGLLELKLFGEKGKSDG